MFSDQLRRPQRRVSTSASVLLLLPAKTAFQHGAPHVTSRAEVRGQSAAEHGAETPGSLALLRRSRCVHFTAPGLLRPGSGSSG